METSVGIFFDLFGCFEVSIESIAVVILAVDSGIILADLRTSFINAAAVVLLEVFAGAVNEKEPIIVFCKHGGVFMQEIPADEAESLSSFRAIDRKGKILTAFGRAMIAQNLSWF